jgi:2-polyprenyl-6-methoxyphenol hydroxylase-like FAD-dependent oxidoreductase
VKRALIVGGSLGGVFAAHLLRSIGWNVTVFERIGEDLASRGAGIGTHDALDEIMARLGHDVAGMGVVVREAVALALDGRHEEKLPIRRVMSAWSTYYRPLRAALPQGAYRTGMTLARIAQTKDGVTAIFADGSRAAGDLLIGADGMRSTVREQFLPEIQPSYAGYIAWRALAGEAELPPPTRTIFENFSHGLPAGEVALSYPVPGREGETRAGERSFNFVWYRRADAETLARLCTDASGRCHGTSIPPPLVRGEVIAEVREAGRALLAPQMAAFIAGPTPLFFQAIFDLASPALVFGSVALLGDAGFVARPHVGAGVSKAAIDAACLADALVAADHDVPAALAAYGSAQSRFGQALVARGQEMGAYLEGRAGTRMPLWVMREHSAKLKSVRPQTAGRRSGWLRPDPRYDYYYD